MGLPIVSRAHIPNLYLRYIFQLAGTQTQKNHPVFHVFTPKNTIFTMVFPPCRPKNMIFTMISFSNQHNNPTCFTSSHSKTRYLRCVFQVAGKQKRKNHPIFHVFTPKNTIFTMIFPPCRQKNMIFTIFSVSNQHNNPTCFTSSHSKIRYLRRFCYFPAH